MKAILYLLTTFLLGFLGIIGLFSIVANASNEAGDINESQTTQPVAYLPLITSNRPCDIDGQTTVNGYPTQGITISLSSQFFEDFPHVVMTTTTNIDGHFCFSEVPLLPSCGGFWYGLSTHQSVTTSTDSLVEWWNLFPLYRCEESQVYRDISVELADFEIITPTENLTVSLPIQFDWERTMASESYTLRWQQASCEYTTKWHTNISSIEITEIPDCYEAGQPVYWTIRGEYEYGTVRSQEHTFILQP